MTREEAINVLNTYDVNFDEYRAEEIAEAIDLAIEALKADVARWSSWNKTFEQSEIADLISRADVLEGLKNSTAYLHDDIYTIVNRIPSAETTGALDDAIAKYVADGLMELPVVRCKDCRYFKKIVERSDSGLCHRDLVASAWKENGYCSRGERREDANTD